MSNIKKYECPECGEVFLKKDLIRVSPEDIDVYGGESRYGNYLECPECGYRTTYSEWRDYICENVNVKHRENLQDMTQKVLIDGYKVVYEGVEQIKSLNETRSIDRDYIRGEVKTIIDSMTASDLDYSKITDSVIDSIVDIVIEDNIDVDSSELDDKVTSLVTNFLENNLEDEDDEKHGILIKFWETEDDRDLGICDVYDYYDISELKDVIKIAKDLQYDWNYASVEVQNRCTGETYYFTDGEEEEYFGIAKDLKESVEIKKEAYTYYWQDDIEEIGDTEADDELLYEFAENLINTDPDYANYNDPWEVIANIISVWKIAKRSRLYDYLLKWYGSEEEMKKNIRSFYETNDAIYFETGCGYSIFSADLLGGSADGEAGREFTKFVDNGGKKDKVEENEQTKSLEDLQMDIYEMIQVARNTDHQDKETNIKETVRAIMDEYPNINAEDLTNYVRMKAEEIYAGNYDEKTESKKTEDTNELNKMYETGTSELEKAFKTEVKYWLQALADENSNDSVGQQALLVLDDEKKINDIVNELVNGSDDMWSEIHLRIEELSGINYRDRV